MVEEVANLILSKADLYTTSLFTMWLSFIALFPLLTWMFGIKWKKLWGAYLITIILTGIIMTFLILMPEQLASLIEKLKNL